MRPGLSKVKFMAGRPASSNVAYSSLARGMGERLRPTGHLCVNVSIVLITERRESERQRGRGNLGVVWLDQF